MKFNYLKWGKLAFGAILACLIGERLGLQFSFATGIITLLTIQDTKKETLLITLKRILIFAVMTLLSLLLFPITGYTLTGFAILLIPYLGICLLLHMPEAIAPIAVLCTHYISAQSCSVEMIWNEFLILVIGAGTGVILNLFMPDNRRKIRQFQKETDDRIIRILKRMAEFLQREDKSEYTGSCFQELEAVLAALKKEAMIYMANHVSRPDDYFLRYVTMRSRQCARLRQMYENILHVPILVREVMPISRFLDTIAEEFSEENNVESLLSQAEELTEYYRLSNLPESREEFEARAILFELLGNIKAFLQIKRDFCTEQSSRR